MVHLLGRSTTLGIARGSLLSSQRRRGEGELRAERKRERERGDAESNPVLYSHTKSPFESKREREREREFQKTKAPNAAETGTRSGVQAHRFPRRRRTTVHFISVFIEGRTRGGRRAHTDKKKIGYCIDLKREHCTSSKRTASASATPAGPGAGSMRPWDRRCEIEGRVLGDAQGR